MTHSNERLLTVPDLAALLQTTPRSVYHRVHRRELPHVKVGARVYFRAADVDRWLAARTVASRTGDGSR